MTQTFDGHYAASSPACDAAVSVIAAHGRRDDCVGEAMDDTSGTPIGNRRAGDPASYGSGRSFGDPRKNRATASSPSLSVAARSRSVIPANDMAAIGRTGWLSPAASGPDSQCAARRASATSGMSARDEPSRIDQREASHVFDCGTDIVERRGPSTASTEEPYAAILDVPRGPTSTDDGARGRSSNLSFRSTANSPHEST